MATANATEYGSPRGIPHPTRNKSAMQAEARTPRTRTLTDLDLPFGRGYEVDGTWPSFKYFPANAMNGIETMLMSDMAEDQTLLSAEGTPEAFSTGTLKTARAKKEPSRKSMTVARAS